MIKHKIHRSCGSVFVDKHHGMLRDPNHKESWLYCTEVPAMKWDAPTSFSTRHDKYGIWKTGRITIMMRKRKMVPPVIVTPRALRTKYDG